MLVVIVDKCPWKRDDLLFNTMQMCWFILENTGKQCLENKEVAHAL